MYYDKYSIENFELLNIDTDILIEPIDTKVKINTTTSSGLITTINPSITQHRPDKGLVKKGPNELLNKHIRYNYSKGIDIELKEGIFTVLNQKDIICIEHN